MCFTRCYRGHGTHKTRPLCIRKAQKSCYWIYLRHLKSFQVLLAKSPFCAWDKTKDLRCMTGRYCTITTSLSPESLFFFLLRHSLESSLLPQTPVHWDYRCEPVHLASKTLLIMWGSVLSFLATSIDNGFQDLLRYQNHYMKWYSICISLYL